MGRHTDVFPPVHIAMVKAGEKGGFLEGVLARLGNLVQAQADMRGKVVGNLIYPAALVLFGTLVTGVIFWFFVPMFRPMFAKVPGGVPAITQLVFFISDAVSRFGLITLILLVAAVVAGVQLSARPAVKARIESWRTMAPVLGPARPRPRRRPILPHARHHARQRGATPGRHADLPPGRRQRAHGAGHRPRHGSRPRRPAPGAAPGGERLFDDDVIEMIAVGESANNLDDVLLTIAVTIETRIDRLLSGVVRLIEPLLLMLIAGVVVLVAVALLLPMTRLSGNL
jgi:general secretion pathway protein F